MRTCRKCGEAKPLKMFECTNVERGWYRLECKTCTLRRRRNEGVTAKAAISQRQLYERDYHQQNRSHIVAKAVAWAQENPEKVRKNALNHYYRLQDAAIQAYGGYRCTWCGIDDPLVITLDHIDNNGAEERKRLKHAGASFYRWLRDNGYPPGIQVLCMNCNHAKLRNQGVLPESLKGRCNDHPARE